LQKKSILAFKGGGATQKCTNFLWWKTDEFHFVLTPSFLFPERLHCCCIYFHCSYLYNYYNYLEPCALNADFQHFKDIKLPYSVNLAQREDRGWKEAQRYGEDRATLRKTLACKKISNLTGYESKVCKIQDEFSLLGNLKIKAWLQHKTLKN